MVDRGRPGTVSGEPLPNNSRSHGPDEGDPEFDFEFDQRFSADRRSQAANAGSDVRVGSELRPVLEGEGAAIERLGVRTDQILPLAAGLM